MKESVLIGKAARRWVRATVFLWILMPAVSWGQSASPEPGFAMSIEEGPAAHRISLNGDWRFADAGEKAGGEWNQLPVPGNWNTFTEYADYVGDGWYEREIEVPEKWKGQRVYLKFDAVYDIADVWMGEEYLGQHTGGYTPFEFEVTEILAPGEKAKLTVKANNEHVLGAWFQWGGISRDVQLYTRGDLRLLRQKIEPVADLETGTAQVKLFATVENKAAESRAVSVQGRIKELEDVAFRLSGTVPAGGRMRLSGTITLNSTQTRLWHFDDPQLYHLDTTLVHAGRPVDMLSDRFGIRSIAVREDGLYLNGEKIRVMGYNRVHDHRAYGNTEPRSLVRADIDLMKRSGAIFSRIMHAPCAPELLDYCDERGYLIWAEIPIWQTVYRVPMDSAEDAAKAVEGFPGRAMREMMERDWNHPCIIGWSPGNEMKGTAPSHYVQAMRPFVKGLDPTRLYANIHHLGFSYEPTGCEVGIDAASVDLLMMNGYGSNERRIKKALNQLEAVPDMPVFYSEYGGKRLEDLNHTEDFFPMWERLAREPRIVGGALWTLNDYRSYYEKTPASQNRDWGVVDVWRNPKKLFHHISALHQPVRSIAIAREGVTGAASVTIQPRGKGEIPSFTLRGYRWAHELLDGEGRVLEGALHSLGVVEPDSPALVNEVFWKTGEARVLVVSLITNNGYTVAETRFDLEKGEPLPAPGSPEPADPELRKVLPLPGGFMLGVTNLEGDRGLEVVYGTSPGQHDQTLTTEGKGAIRVRGLQDGTAYYGKVRRLLADGPGAWSPEFEVTPDGGLPPKAPVVLGVVRGEEELAVRLAPQEKIHGYEVTLQSGKKARIECAYPGLLVLPKESVSLAVIGEYGVSPAVNL